MGFDEIESDLRLGERLKNWAQVKGFRANEEADALIQFMRAGHEAFGPAFIEQAYRNGDLPSGPADALIGLLGGGKSGRDALKAADDAAVLAGRVLRGAVREPGPLREFEVGTYKELAAIRRSFGAEGAFDIDHVPSKAALRIAREADLGQSLTAAEVRQLEDGAIAVAIDRSMHRDSRTYAGRNNAIKIVDAADLHQAIKSDLNVFVQNSVNRGISDYETMKTVASILVQSRQRGLIR